VSGRLLASAPANILGKLEVHGLGILGFETTTDVPVGLFVDLDRQAERLPDPIVSIVVAGITLPLVAVNSFEGSAPIKVELALDRFGLKT
jgi:serine kinase of HPr protein (carbohydrate metabolism regulator)